MKLARSIFRVLWLGAVLALNIHAPVRADELRPAYIELTQKSDTIWDVRWKASARSRLGQAGAVIIPENCSQNDKWSRQIVADNILTTGSLSCEGELSGQTIGLDGLERTTTDALVRIAPFGGEVVSLRLTPDAPVADIGSDDPANAISNVAHTYAWLGVEHILFGFDHLLFVLALVLLLRGGWVVAKTVTAFTIAHSLTLIGTTMGWLSLPPRPVEAVIALSIVFLAVEIVKARDGEKRLSERFPWAAAFLFGLLHGFGFAGALAEIGLPKSDVPLALLMFNLGVEIGQLVIVVAVLALLAMLRRYANNFSRPVRLACAYAIGIISTYWFIERMWV